ncbi:MAG: glycoside hydrolase family 3 protein [Acidimicrobiales bacterium]
MVLAVVLALLAAACGGSAGAGGDGAEPGGPEADESGGGAAADGGAATTAASSGRAREILATLTVDEKIGQLLMPVPFGTGADAVSPAEAAANQAQFGVDTPAQMVTTYHLGGMLYLSNNIVSSDQLARYSAGLQAAARRDGPGVGMLIAVDQEGGRVNRITDGVTVFPAAALLAGDPASVREAGYLTGRQVAVQGVNVGLAPVADVTDSAVAGAIGNRSYGDDPAVVSEMVTAAVDGLQSAGVAAAVKHWPGHGATQVDSHDTLPVINNSREQWEQHDVPPFRAAIDDGVDIVVVGHLAFPAVDPNGGPASMSATLVEQELRQNLGFDGVVMTDAMNMGAVSDVDPGQMSVQSIVAGVDVLLVAPNLSTTFPALQAAVADGTITAERLDEAALRVLELKGRLGLLPDAG